MKIKIVRPEVDHPLVHLHVHPTTDLDGKGLGDILAKHRITLLGRWRPHSVNGSFVDFMAPALLEDEHIKPPKKRGPRKKS